jgi:hypothetical protein
MRGRPGSLLPALNGVAGDVEKVGEGSLAELKTLTQLLYVSGGIRPWGIGNNELCDPQLSFALRKLKGLLHAALQGLEK